MHKYLCVPNAAAARWRERNTTSTRTCRPLNVIIYFSIAVYNEPNWQTRRVRPTLKTSSDQVRNIFLPTVKPVRTSETKHIICPVCCKIVWVT
jgi:hypothetical protein